MGPPSHSTLPPHRPRPPHRGRGRTCGRRGPATRKGGRRTSSRTPPRDPHHHHTPARTPMRSTANCNTQTSRHFHGSGQPRPPGRARRRPPRPRVPYIPCVPPGSGPVPAEPARGEKWRSGRIVLPRTRRSFHENRGITRKSSSASEVPTRTILPERQNRGRRGHQPPRRTASPGSRPAARLSAAPAPRRKIGRAHV